MILGKHTVAETRDLIKVVDHRVKRVDDGFKRIPQTWAQANTDEYRLLKLDLENVLRGWNKDAEEVSHALILKRVANPAVPADMIVSEKEWRRILGYVEYGASSGVERQKGDLRDVNLRIDEVLRRTSQPTINLQDRPDMKSEDADIIALKKLDAVIKTGEQAAKDVKQSAFDFAKSNPGKVLIGAVVLLGAGVVVTKVYL